MKSNNAQKYLFADFTIENYRRLIRLAKKNYLFRTYEDFRKDERFVIWRHDVDASPHIARKSAEIDASEGVVATYFFNLHSEFYNLLESSVSQCVQDILSMGHHVGLHFDAHYYDVTSGDQLDQLLSWEKQILEKFFQCEIRIFSFHHTTPFILSCQRWQYAGLLNVYSEYFQTHVLYCSDSGGYWRYRRLEDILNAAKDDRLQVLTHPEFWTKEVTSPKQRVDRCIDDRAERTRQWYRKNLEAIKHENIDWE
jgi:hypothetical protein